MKKLVALHFAISSGLQGSLQPIIEGALSGRRADVLWLHPHVKAVHPNFYFI